MAPACLTIGEELQRAMNIPVVNNHREAVAVGVLAGVLNSLKLVDKRPEALKVVINGSGAAGIGTAEILLRIGVHQHHRLRPPWRAARRTGRKRCTGPSGSSPRRPIRIGFAATSRR